MSTRTTALLLACADGHEAAAALLVDPTKAADALDAVGDDGFSALLWVDSEERGLRSVSHKLCECGATDMHWPPLALFRGECGAVQIKVVERTVAFVDSFVKRERGREGERERGREGEEMRGTGGGKSERERERRER